MCGVQAVESAPRSTTHRAEHAMDTPAPGAIRKLGVERLCGPAQTRQGLLQRKIA